MSHCFFCASPHDVSSREYHIPLCQTCRHLSHFEVLLLMQLCFLHATLTEIQEALDPSSRRYGSVVKDALEDLGDDG